MEYWAKNNNYNTLKGRTDQPTKHIYLSHLALPPVLGDAAGRGPEAVCVESAVTNVAEQEAVLVVGEATVLAPLTLLALPPSTYHGRDPNVGAGVEVVLAAHRAEQQVLELVGRQLGHLAKLPRLAVVVQVLGGAVNCRVEKKRK